jgi:hypothetical protein
MMLDNNNAEHAIKSFANYRRDADGRFTERTLHECLVLATVFETCEFNNVNVLEFLLSQEMSLEGLLRMAGHKAGVLRPSTRQLLQDIPWQEAYPGSVQGRRR